MKNKLVFFLLSAAFAAPAPAQEPAAGGLERLARALGDRGVISSTDTAEILRLAARETPAESAVSLPPGMKIKIGGLGQVRHTCTDAAPGKSDTSSWKVRSARLTFSGRLAPDLAYQAQGALERASGSTSTVNSALLDASLSYAPAGEFTLTLGQFKIPAGAESYQSPADTDLVDVNYAESRILNPQSNRDVGAMASGKLFQKKLFYAAGIFNGRGPNYAENNDKNFLYSLRVSGTAWKGRVFGRDASLTLGAAGMRERTAADSSLLKASDLPGVTFRNSYRRLVYTGDAGLKAGRLGFKSAYITALLDGRRGDPDLIAQGFYQQLSCGFLNGKLETLARYQAYEPSNKQHPRRSVEWTTLGVNYFIKDRGAKIQANYTFRNRSRTNASDREFVTQFQFSF